MDRSTFTRLVHETRVAHPRWLSQSDQAPDREFLEQARRDLGADLPEEYIDFVQSHGGGDFAFTVVYSLDPSSDLNILEKNAVPWLSRSDFIAFSDNGSGDYYGFLVEDGRAGPAVWLLDH